VERFFNNEMRVVVQGITGSQGRFHTQLMLNYGTNIVAGVTPGKRGNEVHGVPVYDTVDEAVRRNDANTSIVFVPAPYAAEAALEAIEANIKTLVIITEHIPIRDSIEVMSYAEKHGVIVVGPNTPGVIVPTSCKLGIMPAHVFKEGSIGIASRSGTLTYEVAAELSRHGLGQSICLGLGGDPVVGLSFTEVLRMFEQHQKTESIVLIGEIGGNAEEQAAEYISSQKYSKPVVAFIAGRTAPTGKRMGHAGAIVMGKTGTAESKITTLKSAGVKVAEKTSDIPQLLL
jgi:succinyl-CoA synthetase alpha subunit